MPEHYLPIGTPVLPAPTDKMRERDFILLMVDVVIDSAVYMNWKEIPMNVELVYHPFREIIDGYVGFYYDPMDVNIRWIPR